MYNTDTGYVKLITLRKPVPFHRGAPVSFFKQCVGELGTIMNNGWITLHRKLKDSPIYKDSQAFHVWCHLLLSVNHKKGTAIIGSQIVDVDRGQIVTGRKSIAYATGVNTSKVQRLLKMFENLGQIEQQTFNKYRLISITNFDTYQSSEQQVNSKRTASEQQVNTNNNVNNVNNGNKKEKERDYPKELNTSAWNEYIDYRKESKIRKLTLKGEEKQIEKIIGLGDYNTQQQCINETIANGWQGIFPPKGNNGNGKSKAGRFLDRCVDGWNDS